MKRNFIEIDEERCDGCGRCVVACAEGALRIVEGKAKVVHESFCDGLGACIGHCPTGALKIVQKDVAAFDETAAEKHLDHKGKPENKYDVPCGCPGTATHDFRDNKDEGREEGQKQNVASRLKQWPIQLHLVNPGASYFQDCNLLIAASCTAFSFGDFHNSVLKNHALVIACPKLDRTEGYVEKLSDIIKRNNILSITVFRMEVPCCMGLTRMVKEALTRADKKVPFLEEIISIKGEFLNGEG
ncbi:MAG: 4Fe-4S binding protein [Candidatus Omnitrophica bacterium]|nr:4Fe-4S binding protein [Candidatus Omnitrophota bacterium]